MKLRLLMASWVVGAAGLWPLSASVLADGAASDTTVIRVVLDNKNFVPIDPRHGAAYLVPYTWRGCKATDIMNKLKKNKPEFITREPLYQGTQRLYGYLTLGNHPNNRFYFAMDVLSPQDMRMYFDSNRNGFLDDDGPPLKNEGHFEAGDNGFATMLKIPWEQLIVDSPYKGEFWVWFMINNFQWAMAGHSHCSRTQLKGTVTLDGVAYPAVVADRAENDNDAVLTNDGITLQRDFEAPRTISYREAKEGVVINNKRYIFDISYAKGR